ncbi:putative zinc-binding metallopeptidase [Mycobacterium sp. pR1184]|uniref:putative zinc-binding metallopeptidase n=1 Tax=Mycobacterium sp. pR1184 TaxID=3238981 RepID=UPI00351B6AF8
MRAFACPVCHGFVTFESHRCPNCQAALGFHAPSMAMVATSSGAAVVDGSQWIQCTKAADLGCNWLVPAEQPDHASRGRCLPDSAIRREPAADDTIALEKLVSTAVDLRRLIYQLLDLALPVDPFWRADGGLAFDLLSSYSSGQKIVIGHAGGVITIDLTESLDAYRESLRVHLGEPYRTMLGHFRHEVGHYYQNLLVETGPGVRYLDECRELFGDERADYQAAIARHYQFGAPESWEESFISEYATMHPWEDFAECFAHYLHITDTINTVREAGLILVADRASVAVPRDIVPLASYAEAPIEQLLYDWQWLALFFNRINTAMGKAPLYPFEIPPPVIRKLGFVHKVIRQVAPTGYTGPSNTL